MRDLRVRFGFVLAMALLPLLMFTVWQSFDEYNQEKANTKAIVEDTAIRTSAEIVNTLNTTKSVLSMAGESIAPESCHADLKRLSDNFSTVYNLIVADAQGRIICSVEPVRSPEIIKTTIKFLTPENNFHIDLHEFVGSQSGPKTVVITSLGVFENDKLKYMIRAGSDLREITGFSTRTELLDDISISVFSKSGDFIIGDTNFSADTLKSWTQKVMENGRHESFYRNELNEKRNITVIPTREKEVFIALNAPRPKFININKINSISSAIIPLLAWAFAFAAIWITTNKLLINHLQPMTLTAKKYAKGDYDARVGRLKDAPVQIQELADTIDVMAERISERDSKLTESLAEKENLLREVHHRVKNNLQIIISLLNLQKRQLKDPKYVEAITETRNRVNAIALVHKALYESDDIRKVEMEPFLVQLIPQLKRSLQVGEKNITVESDISCYPRDADRATTIAMFIVEAVTNCVKHGVPAGGHIDIKVKDFLGETVVSVEDNGVSDVSKSSPIKGTGDRLMVGFARQLSGQYHGGMTENGYRACLTFSKFL